MKISNILRIFENDIKYHTSKGTLKAKASWVNNNISRFMILTNNKIDENSCSRILETVYDWKDYES